MEGKGRSLNVMEGQGRSWKVFSHHWIDISGEKSYWWLGWWPVGIYCQPQSQSSSSGLWILDFGLVFWTWILDWDNMEFRECLPEI